MNTNPIVGDAFGEALLACWENNAAPNTAYEIVERDDGYLRAADIARYFQSRHDLPWAESWAIEHVLSNTPVGTRLLDIGCGSGQHAAILSDNDHRIMGIDPSHGAITIARQRGFDARLGTLESLTGPRKIGTRSHNILHDGWAQTYLLLGNNIALLGPDTGQARGTLQRLADIADPTGDTTIIATGHDPDTTNDASHLTYHMGNQEAGRPSGHTRIRLRHRRIATPWFDYTHRTLDDLETLLDTTEWHMADHIHFGNNYAVRLTRQPTNRKASP